MKEEKTFTTAIEKTREADTFK